MPAPSALLALPLAACVAGYPVVPREPDDAQETTDTGTLAEEVGGVAYPLACSDVFDPEVLPEFEIEVADADWTMLEYLWANGYRLSKQGIDPKIYFPCTFRYGDEVYEDAAVRLKGNPCCSWYGTKMQFDVSFKEYDEQGRFHGMRKIDFDAPPYDSTLLHNRMAFALYADIGVPSLCVHNARLVVNGSYYGIYALMEHMDSEFLDRNFKEAGGTLYKYGWWKVTNEDDPDYTFIYDFWSTTDVDALEGMADLEQAVLEWAGEAMIPDGDGFWAGSWNFYLYDHPSRGLLWIPWDNDYSWEVVSSAADPMTWVTSWGTPQIHYVAVTADPYWNGRYLDALATVRAAYDPDRLVERVDAWSAQIEPSVIDDPNLYTTPDAWALAVEWLRIHIRGRAAFVDSWLAMQP